MLMFYQSLYNNQINVCTLIGESAMAYCASKPMETSGISELLYKSNRPQVSMVYRHDKPLPGRSIPALMLPQTDLP